MRRGLNCAAYAEDIHRQAMEKVAHAQVAKKTVFSGVRAAEFLPKQAWRQTPPFCKPLLVLELGLVGEWRNWQTLGT